MAKGILVINSGSISVKFAGYRHDGGEDLSLAVHGQVEAIGSQPHFIATGADGQPIEAHEWKAEHPLNHDGAVRFILGWLNTHIKDLAFVAAGHRLVLGGVRHDKPVLVDEAILAELESLCEIEPSHQPYEIAAISAVAKIDGDMPQVACFDTSFHRTMPEIAQLYALPLGLSRHILRLHQPRGSEICSEREAGDRRSSRRRLQPLRHAGRQIH
jgi:acetate kinase